jgi:hypothetical protein
VYKKQEYEYSKYSPDGTSEFKKITIVENSNSGLIEFCVAIAFLAVSMLSVTLILNAAKSHDADNNRRVDRTSIQPEASVRENLRVNH